MSSYVVSSSMDTNSVSSDFFNACAMMHEMINELYESLHDGYGNPVFDEEQILELTKEFKNKMRLELDMIKSSVHQHLEENAKGQV
jgi:hypothetical protein